MACDNVIELVPQVWGFQDRRGIARALTGDIHGAIEDFQVMIDIWNKQQAQDEQTQQRITQRQQWIEALRKGETPFTPKVLEKLRQE